MRPLRTRLQEARQRLGIPWEILERDYLLSWVLAGIGQVPVLRDTLVCKGGTGAQEVRNSVYWEVAEESADTSNERNWG